MRITPREANEILSREFPSPKVLKRFPFGELLLRLWNLKGDDEFQTHGRKVLECMNTLLSNDPDVILGRSKDDYGDPILASTQEAIKQSLGGSFDADTRALFLLAALYHDIGKYIIKERHPSVGWYTMEYLNSRERDDLRSLLGDREDYLQLLMLMIRDHDEFGVLSTGEASYPILLRAANSLGNNVEDQKRVISAIMWLNLADMAGTPGLKLTTDDARKIKLDLEWALAALDTCAQKNERIDDFILKEASREELVEERICRLLLEASRGIPKRYEELCKPSNKKTKVSSLVKELIQTVYPTQIPRRDFAIQFTHICKLDYGKRFFASLVEYYEGPPESDEKRSLPKWAKTRVDVEDLIYAVLAILRRLTSTYSAMIRVEGGPGSLIGVEMKDLTPRNAPEKTAQIIELLLKSHYPGLSWMMSDCLAWYF